MSTSTVSLPFIPDNIEREISDCGGLQSAQTLRVSRKINQNIVPCKPLEESLMKYALMLVLCLSGLTLSFSRAQDSGDTEYLRALTTVYSVSKIGGFVKDWCDARAPQTKAVTDKAIVAWRKKLKLDEVETRFKAVVGDKIEQVNASIEQKRDSTYQGLDGASQNPSKDCLGLEQYLNNEVNPQKLYPAEYQLVFSRPAATQGATNTPGTAPNVQGTVYTVAQLSAMAKNALQAKQNDEKVLKALGPFFVQGVLVKPSPKDKDGVVFLETRDERFHSKYSITCYDLSLGRLFANGTRALTLGGKVKEVYASIIRLEDCQVIANPNGLTPATLDARAGLYRNSIPPEKLMTKANQGLKLAQLEGIVYGSHGEYQISGYQFVENCYLLLKDGTLYNNLQFTPADLNVGLSRTLEPQHWASWKRQGNDILVQWHDEDGKPNEKWQKLEGFLKPSFKAGATLNGSFETKSSYTIGTLGNGTSSVSSTVYSFAPNGQFRYFASSSLYGSTDVGTGQDGASGAVATGSGGASFGPNGTSATSFSNKTDEGTYSIDGYTLELRAKSGVTVRAFAFLWDTQQFKDHLVINGTTYSIPTKK
jgi:hypothetical protein